MEGGSRATLVALDWPQVGCVCEKTRPETGALAPGVCLSKSCKAPLQTPSPSPRWEMDDLSDKGNRFHHSVIRQRRSPELRRGGPRACHSGAGEGRAREGETGGREQPAKEEGGRGAGQGEGEGEPGIKTTLRNETC